MGVCLCRCKLPSALLAEWPGSFTCHCSNTGVERTPGKSQHTKLTLEKKILPQLLLGVELATFQSRVRRANQQAIPLPLTSELVGVLSPVNHKGFYLSGLVYTSKRKQSTLFDCYHCMYRLLSLYALTLRWNWWDGLTHKQRQIRHRTVEGSIPDRSCGRMFFCRLNFPV